MSHPDDSAVDPDPTSETTPDPSRDDTAVTRVRKWIRGHLIVTSLTAALIVFLIVAALLRPPRLHPGQIVDDFGTYRSPSGRLRLSISESTEGNVNITMLRPVKRFHVLTTYSENGVGDFEAEREWFLCFDEYDRLWLFVGRWDPRWGELRKMPYGGYCPPQPSVQLAGFWFLQVDGQMGVTGGNGGIGGTLVSSTGHWEGVPPEFFERIPGKDEDFWGEIPPIPDAPPALSPSQRRMAAIILTD